MSTNKSRRRRQASITGRDDCLILQALAYAIVTIERLPAWQQERFNKEQMKQLLAVGSYGHAQDFLTNAQRHIDGVRPAVSGWSEHNHVSA